MRRDMPKKWLQERQRHARQEPLWNRLQQALQRRRRDIGTGAERHKAKLYRLEPWRN
jgi:hypothetical protein